MRRAPSISAAAWAGQVAERASAFGMLAPVAKLVAPRRRLRQNSGMARSMTPRRNLVLQTLVSVLVAAALVAAATAARVALEPQLGALSPFMLYVGAVLIAGLVRGPLCGALVMLAGGMLGLRLFLMPHHVESEGSMIALMIF